jgi:hypothetical protein
MRTGYRLALAIAGVTVIAAIALLVIEAVGANRDANAYGEVAVPGRESVSLPRGEVIVFYGERIGKYRQSPLAVPPTLRLRVRTTGGALLGSTPSGFSQFDDGDYVRRSIAKMDVPEPGSYEAVSPTQLPGAVEPVISFGKNSTRNFGYALFVLAGGLLLASILAVGAALRSRLGRPGG